MRETGPIRKRAEGDLEAATDYTGLARVQLGILKNRMAFAGLQVLSRQIALPDGTIIQVQSVFGQDTIQIEPPLRAPALAPPERLISPEIPIDPAAVWTYTTTAVSGTIVRLLARVLAFSGGVVDTLRDITYDSAAPPASILAQAGSFVNQDATRLFEFTSGTIANPSVTPYVMRVMSKDVIVAEYSYLYTGTFIGAQAVNTFFSNDGTEAVIVLNGTPVIIRVAIAEVAGVMSITEQYRTTFIAGVSNYVSGHVDPFEFVVLPFATAFNSNVRSYHIAPDMHSVLLEADSNNVGFEQWVISVSLTTGDISFRQNLDVTTPGFFLDPYPLLLPVFMDFVYAGSDSVYSLVVWLSENPADSIRTGRVTLFLNGAIAWTFGIDSGLTVGIPQMYEQSRLNVSADGTKYSFVIQTRDPASSVLRRIDYFQYRSGETNVSYTGTMVAAAGVNPRHASRVATSASGNAAVVRGITALDSAHIGYMKDDGTFALTTMTGDVYPSAVTLPTYPVSQKIGKDFYFPQPYSSYQISPAAGQSVINGVADPSGSKTFSYKGLPAVPNTPVPVTGYLGHQNYSH